MLDIYIPVEFIASYLCRNTTKLFHHGMEIQVRAKVRKQAVAALWTAILICLFMIISILQVFAFASETLSDEHIGKNRTLSIIIP